MEEEEKEHLSGICGIPRGVLYSDDNNVDFKFFKLVQVLLVVVRSLVMRNGAQFIILIAPFHQPHEQTGILLA